MYVLIVSSIRTLLIGRYVYEALCTHLSSKKDFVVDNKHHAKGSISGRSSQGRVIYKVHTEYVRCMYDVLTLSVQREIFADMVSYQGCISTCY